MAKNKYILSIAGLDPSSGAGITSDIKTFEAHGLYGLSVCTAITIQNDINFYEYVYLMFALPCCPCLVEFIILDLITSIGVLQQKSKVVFSQTTQKGV